jgi:hypothetical protein
LPKEQPKILEPVLKKVEASLPAPPKPQPVVAKEEPK